MVIEKEFFSGFPVAHMLVSQYLYNDNWFEGQNGKLLTAAEV